jgi:hypothetical protein
LLLREVEWAIERLLVQPMSNLIATDEVPGGDWIRVDFDNDGRALRFARESEGLPIQDMARLVDTSIVLSAAAFSVGAAAEVARTQTAKSSKRG